MMRVKNHQTPPTIRPERDLWKNTHHQIALKTFLDFFFFIEEKFTCTTLLSGSSSWTVSQFLITFLRRANLACTWSYLVQLSLQSFSENKDRRLRNNSSEPTPSEAWRGPSSPDCHRPFAGEVFGQETFVFSAGPAFPWGWMCLLPDATSCLSGGCPPWRTRMYLLLH